MKLAIATTVATTLALAPLLAADREPAKRLDEAAAVFSEIMAAPDKGIPQDLLENAHCIVIVPDSRPRRSSLAASTEKVPVLPNKGGVGWSAPGTVRIEGGSVGFQIGGSATDLIMLVMNERGADKLLSSKFTSGRGRLRCRRPRGTHGDGSNRRADARRDSFVVAIAGTVCRPRSRRSHAAAGSGRQRHPLRQETGEPADREEWRARPRRPRN